MAHIFLRAMGIYGYELVFLLLFSLDYRFEISLRSHYDLLFVACFSADLCASGFATNTIVDTHTHMAICICATSTLHALVPSKSQYAGRRR